MTLLPGIHLLSVILKQSENNMNQKATKITNIEEKGKKLAILKTFFLPRF